MDFVLALGAVGSTSLINGKEETTFHGAIENPLTEGVGDG